MRNCSLPFIRNITLAALAAFLLGAGTASAQNPVLPSDARRNDARPEPRPAIGVIARCHGDSVILRWAPTTPVAWQVGNAAGYVVERYQLTRLGKPDYTRSAGKSVTDAPAPETLAGGRLGTPGQRG